MKSISELAQDHVMKNPYMADALRDGFINISAFARHIIPDLERQLGEEVKLTSVIMAIQRMNFGSIGHESKKLKSLFKKVKNIQVRNQLCEYTVKQSTTLQRNLGRLLQKISIRQDSICNFTQGVFECTIIISASEHAIFDQLFSEEVVMTSIKKLSSFTIFLPPENTQLSGVYYYILKQLAWSGINLVEVISTSNEFTLVVKEKESEACFETLNKLIHG